ncbi:hypothetical protein, partial [Enterococcus faecium]|uniref:hypothetical protein n=1 Tax=Enterococcus faecium TaxID=1352 RepID=UPI00295F0CA2
MGNPSLNHRYRKGFYSLFKTLQQNHLVEQGGSRRGAQMIMLNDWHPDIFEFIISKIQNPAILQNLI